MAPRKNKNKTPRIRKEPTSLSNPVFELKYYLPLTVSEDNEPVSPSTGLLPPQAVEQSVDIPTNNTGESAETQNYDANTNDPGPATPSQDRRNYIALTERRLQQSQDLPAFRHNNSGEVETVETIPTSDMELTPDAEVFRDLKDIQDRTRTVEGPDKKTELTPNAKVSMDIKGADKKTVPDIKGSQNISKHTFSGQSMNGREENQTDALAYLNKMKFMCSKEITLSFLTFLVSEECLLSNLFSYNSFEDIKDIRNLTKINLTLPEYRSINDYAVNASGITMADKKTVTAKKEYKRRLKLLEEKHDRRGVLLKGADKKTVTEIKDVHKKACIELTELLTDTGGDFANEDSRNRSEHVIRRTMQYYHRIESREYTETTTNDKECRTQLNVYVKITLEMLNIALEIVSSKLIFHKNIFPEVIRMFLHFPTMEEDDSKEQKHQ